MGLAPTAIAGSFTFGTAGNSTERGPGYRQVDFSVFKDFTIWREQKLGFRTDFFNAFNIASYGQPDTNINDTTPSAKSRIPVRPRVRSNSHCTTCSSFSLHA